MYLNSIFGSSIAFQMIIALFAGFYTYAMYFLLLKNKKNKKKRDNNFIDSLVNGLKIGTIVSLNDVYNIFKGSNDTELDNDVYRYRINKILRRFLVDLQLAKYIDDEVQIKHWKAIIDEFILENEQLSPFSELPQTERNIMNDLTSFLKTDDKEAIKRKLFELSSAIQLRNEQLEKVEKQNKWSMPLSLIGLVLTIYFGIISLK